MKLLKIIKAHVLDLFVLGGAAIFVLSNQFPNLARANPVTYALGVTALFVILALPFILARGSRPDDRKSDQITE